MDPVSQGVLGAAAAQTVAPRQWAPWAALLGGLSGLAPDLDALIRRANDPLLFLEYHRQFTHALLFIPVGALICAVMLHRLLPRRLPFATAYLYCLVGYGTHGLLDACTSYGTQLFWPFSDVRIAWNNVSVVDPLFTFPLLVLALLASLRRRPSLAGLACLWAVSYLLFGVVQRERAESFGHAVAAERGHAPRFVEAKPAFANLLLWKTFYESDGRYRVDAVRMGWQPKSFPGQHTQKLELSRDLPWLVSDSQQARDLERFRWFSAGYVALDPRNSNRVIDVRYSVVPNRIDGLWGLELTPLAAPDAPAKFFTARDVSTESRSEILQMLFE